MLKTRSAAVLKSSVGSLLLLSLSVVAWDGPVRAATVGQPGPVRAAGYDIPRDEHSQTRETFLEMLKDPQMDQDSTDELAKMLRSYRLDQVNGVPSISESPFVGYIIKNQVLASWSSLYDTQYAENYKSYVTNITYEGMFDLLMQAIEANELPDALKSVGGSVGSCLAKKVEETSEAQGCSLDNSDAIPGKPSVLKLAWMKYTCFIPFITSPCSARKAIFDYAKKDLIDAKKKNLMAKVFPQIFPALFRNNVIGGADRIQGDIGGFVSSKFGTREDSDLWSQAPVVDIQDGDHRVTGIGEFASGLAADIRGASVFLESHPEIAAPLFYAAANRLLVLMGGVEASWDAGHSRFSISPDDHFDPVHDPKAPPKFVTDIFGGLGIARSGTGPSAHEVAEPWDIANYSPSASSNPSPLELLPEQFVLGAHDVASPLPGKPTTESMVDLGNLMNALVDFLQLTSPRSNLASHFIDVNGDPDASSKITDAKDPALFPRQGRQLAAGMIAAIVQNMIAPNGHVVIPQGNPGNPPVDEHSGLLGFRFYNEISLDGRKEGKFPTTALGSVFSAASRFSVLAGTNDPDIPAQLLQFKSKIDQAVDISMLSMIGRSQQSDGGFVDHLGDPASSERSIDTQVSAMSSLTTVYTQTLEPAQRLALRQAWLFLDKFWPNGSDLPVDRLSGDAAPAPDAGPLSAVSAWGLLNLWTQTQASPLYNDLTNPADDQVWGKDGWDKWQSRFDTLRKQLEAQLDSAQGPGPLQN